MNTSRALILVRELMLRGVDYTRAIADCRFEIEWLKNKASEDPRHNRRVKSWQMALEALILCRDAQMELIVLSRTNQARKEAKFYNP